MRHSFIDKYSDINSPIHRFDPRLKLILTLLGVIIIATQPRNELMPYAFYGGFILILLIVSQVPIIFIAKRLLFVLPFILMASLFFPISKYISNPSSFTTIKNETTIVSISIFLKALFSVSLLILLVSTEKFHNIISGMRMLGIPKLIGIISALMYRYVFIFADEAMKTSFARSSRTPGKLRLNRFKVYGNQMAMVFIRSWDRSQTIYNAMISRGFRGEFPPSRDFSINRSEFLLFSLIVLIFITIRIANIFL